MRLNEKEILFDTPAAFQGFIYDLHLIGLVHFSRPVVDQAGKILIKESICVRDSMLDRMSELSDQVKMPIALEITDEILNRIRHNLTAFIMQLSDQPGHAFLYRMYRDRRRNPRAFVLHAFRNRKLALLAFRLRQQKPEFFVHCALLGLLTLGIVLHRECRVPMIYRHAFMAGFCSLIGQADTDQWAFNPEADDERKRRLFRSAAFMDQLGTIEGLGTVIRASFTAFDAPVEVDPQFGDLLGDFTEESPPVQSGDDDSAPPEQNDEAEATDTATPEKVDNAAVEILTEALRIARFAYEHIAHSSAQSGTTQSLVQQLAYNTARGYFSKDLIDATLDRFEEYEQDVRYLAAVAEVESRCLHGKEAWAYPKPRATQVLCSAHMLACPYINGGWTFHLVAPQNAFGRIGRELPVGTYHKCVLEEDLPESVADHPALRPRKRKQAATSGQAVPADPELPPVSDAGHEETGQEPR